MNQHLDRYKEGWRTGNAPMILGALADDFVYDDPVDGRFTRADFGAYLERLFAGDDAFAGDEGFEEITEEVVREEGGEVTAWAWFRTATEEGAGLMKAGPDGVHLERLAYYRPPEA
jgi:hypothetical protein